jgi:hypothetical protein
MLRRGEGLIMGVHFGVVAARTSWDRLLGELVGIAGEFVDRGPVTDIRQHDFRSVGEGATAVCGEHEGAAFVLDVSMLLWSAGLERFVDVSRRLECAVGLALGESVSGTFGLLAAERGAVRRVYYNCVSSVSQPFEVGEPLPSEADTPLEEIDGHGLWNALKSHGLDFEGWYEGGIKRAYAWAGGDLHPEGSERGPIAAEIDRHWERYRLPKDKVPGTTVVRRRLPDGSTGWDIVPAPPRASLLARLLGLLSRKP